MLHIDKFQDLNPIAHIFQDLGPQSVRIKSRHPLLNDPIAEHRGKQAAFHLPVQLMLAAGYGKDHLRAPADRLLQRVIRRRITGMERNHHVHPFHALVGSDIAR